MIQEKMNVLEQVGLSESNISEKAESASFHSKVSMQSFDFWSVFSVFKNESYSTIDGNTVDLIAYLFYLMNTL